MKESVSHISYPACESASFIHVFEVSYAAFGNLPYGSSTSSNRYVTAFTKAFLIRMGALFPSYPKIILSGIFRLTAERKTELLPEYNFVCFVLFVFAFCYLLERERKRE